MKVGVEGARGAGQGSGEGPAPACAGLMDNGRWGARLTGTPGACGFAAARNGQAPGMRYPSRAGPHAPGASVGAR